MLGNLWSGLGLPDLIAIILACLSTPAFAESAVPFEIQACVNLHAAHGDQGAHQHETFAALNGLNNRQYFALHGLLGWHVTWFALIDYQTEPVRAYETFGSAPDWDRIFGRQRIPQPILHAFAACNVTFMGVWPKSELPTLKRPEAPATTARPNLAPLIKNGAWMPPVPSTQP